MVKDKKEEAKEKKKKSWTFWKFLKVLFVSIGKLFWNIIRIPYWIIKGIANISKRAGDSHKAHSEEKRREKMVAGYHSLKVIETRKGNLEDWENKIIESESTIGLILGARGSGKTAFGLKLAENIKAMTKKKVYAMGFVESEMPSWVDVVEKVEEIEQDSFVLIDEGGILFSSRSTMSKPNKLLSELLLISRHKNLSILFISQNSANLEINALRQADYLVLKPSSLLQKDFERKIIQKLYEETKKGFDEHKEEKGITYIHSNEFQGFVTNPLPTFWSMKISKSFR